MDLSSLGNNGDEGGGRAGLVHHQMLRNLCASPHSPSTNEVGGFHQTKRRGWLQCEINPYYKNKSGAQRLHGSSSIMYDNRLTFVFAPLDRSVSCLKWPISFGSASQTRLVPIKNMKRTRYFYHSRKSPPIPTHNQSSRRQKLNSGVITGLH